MHKMLMMVCNLDSRDNNKKCILSLHRYIKSISYMLLFYLYLYTLYACVMYIMSIYILYTVSLMYAYKYLK